MNSDLEKQFKEVIEKNLPAHVGEVLQKELEELNRLRKGDFEKRALESEKTVTKLKQEKTNLEIKERQLQDKEKELQEKESKLKMETEINEIKINYEKK